MQHQACFVFFSFVPFTFHWKARKQVCKSHRLYAVQVTFKKRRKKKSCKLGILRKTLDWVKLHMEWFRDADTAQLCNSTKKCGLLKGGKKSQWKYIYTRWKFVSFNLLLIVSWQRIEQSWWGLVQICLPFILTVITAFWLHRFHTNIAQKSNSFH